MESNIMAVEVIVAIVSGIAGVVVGSLALVQATKTARLTSEANITLEKMKAENERRRKAFEIASEESKPVENALAQAWHDIQTVKDVISKLLSSARYDVDLALEALTPAKSSLVEGYAKWGTDLPEEARSAWHKAKNCSDRIERTINNLDVINERNSVLPPEVSDRLRELRLSLTDNQMVISASRQTMRDQVARKILEVL